MTSLRLHEPALDYQLIDIAPEQHPFLRKLFDEFGFRTPQVWVDSSPGWLRGVHDSGMSC
ncbi:MAG TPA: hypothetical protein VK573_07820 [Gemmatimonadales bacterium]|nr:hypothetical protein [Gemmatimonadales bacterium]